MVAIQKEEIRYLETPGPHNIDVVVDAVCSYVAARMNGFFDAHVRKTIISPLGR